MTSKNETSIIPRAFIVCVSFIVSYTLSKYLALVWLYVIILVVTFGFAFYLLHELNMLFKFKQSQYTDNTLTQRQKLNINTALGVQLFFVTLPLARLLAQAIAG